jgi:hypothetical protein
LLYQVYMVIQILKISKSLWKNWALFYFLTGWMVWFQTKNPSLGKFCRVLEWKIVAYFIIIWSILRPLEIFYGHFGAFCVRLVHFFQFWYYVPRKIWQPGFLSCYVQIIQLHSVQYEMCVEVFYLKFLWLAAENSVSIGSIWNVCPSLVTWLWFRVWNVTRIRG